MRYLGILASVLLYSACGGDVTVIEDEPQCVMVSAKRRQPADTDECKRNNEGHNECVVVRETRTEIWVCR